MYVTSYWRFPSTVIPAEAGIWGLYLSQEVEQVMGGVYSVY